MRRALPPLLALVLALALLTGCEFSLERLAHGGALPPPPEDYTGLQDGFRYTKTTLTGQERYLYDQLLAGLQNQEETIGDLYPDTEMIQTAIDAIDRDYPELFWFSGTGQIETTLLAGKPLEAAYTPVYTMDQAQRQATQAQIDQWAADCFATIPQGASDYDKALGVFTYIIQHADYQVVDNNSIVNIMVGGAGLCGCYAKTINLDPQAEPEIYRAIRRNALLENVVVRADGSVDYADGSKTENTRVSYPLSHIENIVKPVSRAGHPSKVIFLAADAFGVLPPVSRLTTEQMQYHFLSGFTSKLAGTERGITQPTPTFSACYGAAFLLLHPTQYASVLAAKMAEAGAEAWLVNTGWNGEGKRLSLRDTRNIISAILNGTTGELREETVPVFGLAIPQSVPGVDSALLDPRSGWPSADKWQEKAESLAQLFMDNFKQYSDTDAGARLALAGPTLAKSAVTA